jgi:hypothetical protein
MATQQDIKNAVYGEVFMSAQQQMQLIEQAIELQVRKGFKSAADCEQWAHEHLLTILALGKAQKTFFYVTHYGEIITKSAWIDYYCKDILFWWKEVDKGKSKPIPWTPEGFKYTNRARINGEISDGIRQPLVHRDYFTPTGFYDLERGTFNIAKPFPVAAKQTGSDTSHIYTYIEHLAGECTKHLLAWLRTKMMYPTAKTQVVPIIVSRAQGTGKTTFAEVICKGLFGTDNVIVSEQFDAMARFNSDATDRLIICLEEKEETDRRNPAATIKSRATATTIRKEHKGVDPVYQLDYSEYIMTTNKDVPIKFDGREDQRRFMVMEADPNFTRKTSALADEVFSKLYGKDADGNDTGIPFVEDNQLIAQFKHELYSNAALAKVKLREFPKTAAYERCFNLPRTTEAVEIESILRSIAPFIRASLIEGKLVTTVPDLYDPEKVVTLSTIISATAALQYIPAYSANPSMVALCRPLVFYDMNTGKPFPHAVVERSIMDASAWLIPDFGLAVLPLTSPLPGGFMHVQGRFRTSAASRFALVEESGRRHNDKTTVIPDEAFKVNTVSLHSKPPERIGQRLRVNHHWKVDPEGEYETLNEMKPGVNSLENKSDNVQYLDTFLFESDDTTKAIYAIEEARKSNDAESLFRERLSVQRREAERLFKAGIAARIVYSGGKSYHILVRIKDSPADLDERKWLHAHLSTVISTRLNFDPVTYDPARLTRAPITYVRKFKYHEREVTGTQRLLYENWNNVYEYNWRAQYENWKNRPLYEFETQFGRRLVPTKEEYRDAMTALLKGTFWTDSFWNGRRQQCFFPGYRLCRYLGYTHEQLWAEGGILDGLDKYYRRNEITYWRNRESSDIIRKIDNDIDEMEVESEQEK